ncbi:MAG: V-type ATP synthase subunit E [Bacilli bacterium]
MLIQTLLFTLIPATLALIIIFVVGFGKLIKYFIKPKTINISDQTKNLSKGADELEITDDNDTSVSSNSQVEKLSVYNKIIEKAEAEALVIKENGNKKIKQITEQVIEETKTKINELLKNAEAKNKDLIKTKTAELEQALKQQVLAKQKEIIKSTFKVALDRLLSLNDDDLKSIVVNYLKKVDVEESITIKVNEHDFAKYQNLFSSQHNSNLDLLAHLIDKENIAITLSNDSACIAGGFIVIGKYYDVDYSFESILDNLEEQLITEVSSMLFKSEE